MNSGPCRAAHDPRLGLGGWVRYAACGNIQRDEDVDLEEAGERRKCVGERDFGGRSSDSGGDGQVPCIAYGMTPDELEQMRKRGYGRVEQALKAGVRVAFGSDAYTHNPTWSRGLARPVRADVLQHRRHAGYVIRTATTNAAELLGMEKQIGSIEAGKADDIIGFAGDPLADITELRRARFVMKGGQVIRKP